MRGYSKLDCGIVDSSLWEMPHEYLRVWIAMLAKTDANGYVRVSPPAMARLCHLDRETFDSIIEVYCSPDPDSRTDDDDGRRLEKVEGGWVILNYLKYREDLKQPDISTERVRRFREKQQSCNGSTVSDRFTPFHETDGNGEKRSVTPKQKQRHKQKQKEEEPPASRGGATPKDDWHSKPDPLTDFPKLAAAYPKIHACLEKLHRGVRIPEPESKSEYDSKMEFARLVRLDGFKEDEILDTLRWVTMEEPQTGGFSWRQQFQSIAALREVSKGNTKFAKIHAAYLNFKNEHSAAAPLDPEKAAALDRLHAMHQQGTAA